MADPPLRARPRVDRAYELVMVDFDLQWYPAEPLGEQLLILMPDGRDVLARRDDFEVRSATTEGR